MVEGRKVRAPQGRVVANGDWGQPQGKCHRKDTALWNRCSEANLSRGLIELATSPGEVGNALIPQGKGEKVR